MLETTDNYKTAIKQPGRDIKPKVEIFFDGEDHDPTILDREDIADIDLLEEVQAEGDTPLGTVASNEVIILLKNKDNQFLASNESSPYHGKIKPNVKVIPYYGIDVGESTFEWICLGKYWVSEWEADSGDPYSMVTCHDRLFKLGEQDVPLIPTAENINVYQMFETLFKALGLTLEEYSIDAVLSQQVIPIAYFPDGKARVGLAKMSEAFNCNVSVTRGGIIKVSANDSIGEEATEFTDNDMIFNSNMPQKFASIYSEINVKVNQHVIKGAQTSLEASNVPVPAEGRKLDKLKFSTSPSAYVEYIKLTKFTHLEIKSIAIGTWGLTLEVDNIASANKNTNIDVLTHPMAIAEDEAELRDEEAYDKIGSKKYYIHNYLIQGRPDALEYAGKVAPLVTDPAAYVKLSTRGDPSLELNDVLKATDNTNKLGTIEVVPVKYNYRYDGGLGCEILSIKKSARKPT